MPTRTVSTPRFSSRSARPLRPIESPPRCPITKVTLQLFFSHFHQLAIIYMQIDDCRNAMLEVCLSNIEATVSACRHHQSPMPCFVVLIAKPYSHLGCSMAEFWDLANGFDNI